ncbi:MAG: ABC transporter ATP-binding protein [Bacteroidetes bacterium]|nr:ABC transporter ATP-binding protein [Bacteroidota bacterium]
MSKVVIELENISKQYRLGVVGTGTLSHDLNRWWAKIRGKEDPTKKVSSRNVLHQVDAKYVWALRDVNMKVEEGTVLGVVGKNGAGKSTMLKLLSQVTGPTTGEIRVKGRIASLLEVGTGFHPELTGRDNIYLNGAILGMTKREINRKFDEIVEFSGVKKYIGTPVKRYSSGMYVRLAFAVAAHLESEILIVDEVLAVGDAEFQKKAIGKMKDVSTSGRTVLFVSHNLTAVEQLCNKAVLMQNGTLTLDGSVADVLETYKKSSLEVGEVRPYGTKQVEFLDYSILDMDGNETKEITLGDSFMVRAGIRFNEDLDYTDFSLDIRNDSNEFIAHVTNMDDEFAIENHRKGDKEVIEVTIQNFSLAPGTYYISLWLGNMYGTFNYLENCLRLSVRQGTIFIRRNYPYDKRSRAVLQSSWNYNKT